MAGVDPAAPWVCVIRRLELGVELRLEPRYSDLNVGIPTGSVTTVPSTHPSLGNSEELLCQSSGILDLFSF